jgi:uncharacterized membrane protein (UPF0127 family)
MKSVRRSLGFLFLAACLLASCGANPAVRIVGPDGAPRATVRVEVAASEPQRESGLMYRNQLDENAGMLFVFPAPSHHEFWMKNTEIPLDMIFADSRGRVIGIVRNARPYSETLDAVAGDSQYVLEVNGGFADRHHVAPGDRFEFEHFRPRAEN